VFFLLPAKSGRSSAEVVPRSQEPRRTVQTGANMSITREDVLTVADVAALLDLKPYTVKEYARRGILPGRKLGRNWRFLRPELEEAIKRLPHAPGR
jgi:excisionase family DNA binding protein